jgi:predicted RNA-binding Zn ribbon-like protein
MVTATRGNLSNIILEVTVGAVDFPFFGNALWVDFLNTEPARPGGGRDDRISTPDALVRWAQAASLISSEDAFQPDEVWLEEAHQFRATLRKGADALVTDRNPPSATIVAVNEKLARSPVVSTLIKGGSGWQVKPRFKAGLADALLGRLAADFAETLASGRANRLRRCEHPSCAMMFIDTSKNGKRRWCSMETCGNREKAAGRRARSKL